MFFVDSVKTLTLYLISGVSFHHFFFRRGSFYFYCFWMFVTSRPVTSSDGGAAGLPPQNHSSFQSRRKTKALKALDSKRNYVLGRDIYFGKVESLCYRALIGRLENCSMTKDEWIDWATIH